jgi:predicted enzyme related to lactoylglutathione lyase
MDRVCHFEVPYSDKDRVENFYKTVFGWQISPGPGEMPYSFAVTTPVDEQFMPTEVGGINGGMYPRGDEGGSRTPVIVLQVESTAQRIKDAEAAGGKLVIGPTEVSGMGIYAQVTDSEDNIIGLWQPLQQVSQ